MVDFNTANDQGGNSPDQALTQYLPGQEGSKFKTVEDLARAKYESDTFIENLKREQRELREALKEYETQMTKAKGVDDVLAALKSMSAGDGLGRRSEDSAYGEGNQSRTDHNDSSETRVKEMVSQLLAEREAATRQETNWSTVQSKFMSRYHNDPEEALVGMKATARELGMGFDEFQRVSKTNPNLVLRAAGLAQVDSGKGGNEPVRFGGTGTPGKAEGGPVKNQEYYSKLRQQMRAAGKLADFYSPRIQGEIMQSAKELGDAYFTSR